MMTTIDHQISSVALAREAIAEVPRRRVRLDDWGYDDGPSTVACAAGWLALQGRFGLTCDNPTARPVFYLDGKRLIGIEAMAAAMGITIALAEDLFCSPAWGGRFDRAESTRDRVLLRLRPLTDRWLFLKRCDRALAELRAQRVILAVEPVLCAV